MGKNQVRAKKETATPEEARRSLVKEALQVYGVDEKFVFGCGVYDAADEVVVVTKGGKKFRHKRGEPAKFTLSEAEITGSAPKVKLVWDERLNGRRPKDAKESPSVGVVWDERLNQIRPVDRQNGGGK